MFKYAHIIVGLPGSGKSTWIKENVFDPRVRILSTDNIIQDYADTHGMTYNECFEDQIGEATKTFFNSIIEAVKDGASFIVDRTNLNKKSRKRILDMIPDDYTKVCIYVKCSNMFIHEHRLQNRTGKTIPSKIIDSMEKSFEMPTAAEGFKSVVHIDTAPILEAA